MTEPMPTNLTAAEQRAWNYEVDDLRELLLTISAERERADDLLAQCNHLETELDRIRQELVEAREHERVMAALDAETFQPLNAALKRAGIEVGGKAAAPDDPNLVDSYGEAVDLLASRVRESERLRREALVMLQQLVTTADTAYGACVDDSYSYPHDPTMRLLRDHARQLQAWLDLPTNAALLAKETNETNC